MKTLSTTVRIFWRNNTKNNYKPKDEKSTVKSEFGEELLINREFYDSNPIWNYRRHGNRNQFVV